MRDVLVIAVFVALAALLAFQVYMLRWAKKTARSVPTMVTALRWVNIVALVAGAAVLAYVLLARG